MSFNYIGIHIVKLIISCLQGFYYNYIVHYSSLLRLCFECAAFCVSSPRPLCPLLQPILPPHLLEAERALQELGPGKQRLRSPCTNRLRSTPSRPQPGLNAPLCCAGGSAAAGALSDAHGYAAQLGAPQLPGRVGEGSEVAEAAARKLHEYSLRASGYEYTVVRARSS